MDQTPEYLEMCSKLLSGIKKLVPRGHHGCMDKDMMSSEFPLVGFICPIHQTKLELISTTKEGFILRCEKCDASTLHNGEIFILYEKYRQVTWMNISL